jgi:AcrR family transcriptional regulator
MGLKERRERERAELRGRMLDAARRLFTERGYEHVTMRAIAEAVEYSPAAIYSHFTDKTALFRELCESDFNQFTATFAPLLVISDPIERLLGMGEAYLQFGVAYPEHYKLLFMSKSVPGIEPANGHSPTPSCWSPSVTRSSREGRGPSSTTLSCSRRRCGRACTA